MDQVKYWTHVSQLRSSSLFAFTPLSFIHSKAGQSRDRNPKNLWLGLPPFNLHTCITQPVKAVVHEFQWDHKPHFPNLYEHQRKQVGFTPHNSKPMIWRSLHILKFSRLPPMGHDVVRWKRNNNWSKKPWLAQSRFKEGGDYWWALICLDQPIRNTLTHVQSRPSP